MIVYKYRAFDSGFNEKTLFNLELYFSSTKDFNDPYEGAIPIEYDESELTYENKYAKAKSLIDSFEPNLSEKEKHKRIIKALEDDWLHNKVFKKQRQRDLKLDIENRFGVISFAKSPLINLMWSHYSNKHLGYCLGFDLEILKSTFGGMLFEVAYQDSIPKIGLFDDMPVFSHKLLGTKSSVWNYEDEIRYIKTGFAKKVITYPIQAIKEIYLGCKSSEKNIERVKRYIDKFSIDCSIYKTELDNEMFKLNKVKIL